MSPHYRWETVIDAPILARIFGLHAPSLDVAIEAVDPTGRVRFISANGKRLSGVEFHRRAGRELGWNAVKSTWFMLERLGERFRIQGRGFGHGVGLCQWGAEAMAKQGRTAEEILSFYFPETEIGRSVRR
jgi:stage II sporulation protein D